MSAANDDGDYGKVYVLTNRKRNMAKVGMTRNGTPEGRMRAYTDDHGFMWTEVVAEFSTLDVARVETACHRELYPHKNNTVGTREVFNVLPEHALAVVQRWVESVPTPEQKAALQARREREEQEAREAARERAVQEEYARQVKNTRDRLAEETRVEARAAARVKAERVEARVQRGCSAFFAGIILVLGASLVIMVADDARNGPPNKSQKIESQKLA